MPLENRYFIWAPAPRCSKRDALFPSLLCLPPLHWLLTTQRSTSSFSSPPQTTSAAFPPAAICELLQANHNDMFSKKWEQDNLRTLWQPMFYCQSDDTAASFLRGDIEAKSVLNMQLAALDGASQPLSGDTEGGPGAAPLVFVPSNLNAFGSLTGGFQHEGSRRRST
jgi:hypothetical protein